MPALSNSGGTSPTDGGDDNTWGATLNTLLALFDAFLGDRQALTPTSGDTALTGAQHQKKVYTCTGTLTGNATITFDGRNGAWIIKNGCTLAGFTLKAKVAGQSGVEIPASSAIVVYFDGTDMASASPSLSAALLIANNLSDLASAATARTNLGLTANGSSLVTAANYAAMRTLLTLVVGTDVQAYSAVLATWAGVTPSANGQSLVSAANYAAMVTLLGVLSLAGGTMTGGINMADQLLTRPIIKDYGESVNAIGSTGGGTQDIDLTLGNVVSATVDTSANTFTFSNPSPTGNACSFTLILTNGGSQTVNWPASVLWANNVEPVLTTSGVDILTFITVNGGSTWYGFPAGIAMS